MNFKPKKIKVRGGSWIVFLGLCKGCGLCLVKCPQKALRFGKNQGIYSTLVPSVDPQKCKLCGLCETFCPDSAIKIEK